MFRLDDKIAIITGGSRGIGFGIAKAMATYGAYVILVARSEDQLEQATNAIKAAGGSAEIQVCDVMQREAIAQLVDAVFAEHGKIDILVNNAGINIRKPALELDVAEYDRILNTNLHSVFYLSQQVGKHMVAAKQGKIINIGSITSTYALDKIAAYTTSKGGILQLTRALATEWARHNVQVNLIAPGFIRTELNNKLWEEKPMLDWALGNTPAGRLGVPDDLGGTAVFLASSASDFVTGSVINVDGGFLSGGPWPLP